MKSLIHQSLDDYVRHGYSKKHPPTAEKLLHDLLFFDGLALLGPEARAILAGLRAGYVEEFLTAAILEEITPEEISPCESAPSVSSLPCSGHVSDLE